jgi:NAD(P)H-dependent FMN reductase
LRNSGERHGSHHENHSENFRWLAQQAAEADGFVWGTPVYHSSFSGVLKNTLDHLSSRQFRHKPVALVSNGGGQGGVQPCDQLRIIARSLSAVVIPTQVVTTDSDFVFRNGRYILANEAIHERFMGMADELTAYAVAMRQLR